MELGCLLPGTIATSSQATSLFNLTLPLLQLLSLMCDMGTGLKLPSLSPLL